MAKEGAALVSNEKCFIGHIHSNFGFARNLLDSKEAEIIVDVQKHTETRLKHFSDERLSCAAELSNAKLVQNEGVLALQQDRVNFLSLVKNLVDRVSASQALLGKRVNSPIPSGALIFPEETKVPSLSKNSRPNLPNFLVKTDMSIQAESGNGFIASLLCESISRISVVSILANQEVSRKRPRESELIIWSKRLAIPCEQRAGRAAHVDERVLGRSADRLSTPHQGGMEFLQHVAAVSTAYSAGYNSGYWCIYPCTPVASANLPMPAQVVDDAKASIESLSPRICFPAIATGVLFFRATSATQDASRCLSPKTSPSRCLS